MSELKIDFSKLENEDSKEISSGNIKVELEKILKQVHTQSQKHDVGERDGGLTIACVFCGDSKRNPSRKRGNLYLETSTYKCYNCGIWMPLDELFNKFDSDAGVYIKQFSLDNFINKTNTKVSLMDMYDIKKQYVERGEIMKKMYLTEVAHEYKAAKYLEGRKQDINDRRVAYQKFTGDLVFFNMHEDKVIGLQKRVANPEKGYSRFISYDYGRIMEKVLKVEYNEEESVKIKRISLLYNILNVDLGRPLNVFESAIDSHHFTNSIACWGSNSILKLDGSFYGFDSDNAGNKAATGLLEDGHNVFMWSKFKKENPIYKDCGDFNDVFKLKPITQKIFESYTTNSKLDTILL